MPRFIILKWDNSEAYSTRCLRVLENGYAVVAHVVIYESINLDTFLVSPTPCLTFVPMQYSNSSPCLGFRFENIQTKIPFWTFFQAFLEGFEQGHDTICHYLRVVLASLWRDKRLAVERER